MINNHASFQDNVETLRQQGFQSPYADASDTSLSMFLQAHEEVKQLRSRKPKDMCTIGDPARWYQDENDFLQRQVQATMQDSIQSPSSVVSQAAKFLDGCPDPLHPRM